MKTMKMTSMLIYFRDRITGEEELIGRIKEDLYETIKPSLTEEATKRDALLVWEYDMSSQDA